MSGGRATGHAPQLRRLLARLPDDVDCFIDLRSQGSIGQVVRILFSSAATELGPRHPMLLRNAIETVRGSPGRLMAVFMNPME